MAILAAMAGKRYTMPAGRRWGLLGTSLIVAQLRHGSAEQVVTLLTELENSGPCLALMLILFIGCAVLVGIMVGSLLGLLVRWKVNTPRECVVAGRLSQDARAQADLESRPPGLDQTYMYQLCL